MKRLLLILSTFIAVMPMTAQVSQERQILVTPNAEHPQIAKASGLGGRVTVYVTVDQAGNVVSVGEITGPGSVCPSVTRADVVALRESARTAAANARFAAGETTATIPINFDFPSAGRVASDGPAKVGSGDRFTIKGDRNYTAANPVPAENAGRVYSASNAPPPDYTGPAVVAGSNSGTPAPNQISGGVLNGKAMRLPKPPYPPAARAVRASGAVTIQVLIIEDGTVFSAAAVSGHPLLRSAARIAACGAEFSPTLLMGNPVKVSGVITYNFVP